MNTDQKKSQEPDSVWGIDLGSERAKLLNRIYNYEEVIRGINDQANEMAKFCGLYPANDDMSLFLTGDLAATSERSGGVTVVEVNSFFDALAADLDISTEKDFSPDLPDQKETPSIFTEAERREIINSSITKLVSELAPYVSEDRWQKMFPGLDVYNPQDYNFAEDSKFRLFILPHKIYSFIATSGFFDLGCTGVHLTSVLNLPETTLGKSIMIQSLEDRSLILIDENYVVRMLGNYSDFFISNETKKRVNTHLVSETVKHEVLHELLKENPKSILDESIVALVSEVINIDEPSAKLIPPKYSIFGYVAESQAFAEIARFLLDSGITKRTIFLALLSNDTVSLNRIAGVINRSATGPDSFEKIMKWHFFHQLSY